MKKTLIVVVVLFLIAAGFLFWRTKDFSITNEIPQQEEATNQQPIGMCYYYKKQTSRGFFDKAWLKMNIIGSKVTGLYYNLPAEKDSKVGSFEGTVGVLDQSKMARTADVWWDSLAEGMQVKEELNIDFGDGSATALFGEMIDRGDGVYIYKDKTKLTPGFNLSQIDCNSLDQTLAVEKYVRDNISTIATNKPVLGGTWYVVSVDVNPSLSTSTVVYEDGHIQSTATFLYNFDPATNSVIIKDFKIIK